MMRCVFVGVGCQAARSGCGQMAAISEKFICLSVGMSNGSGSVVGR